MEEVEVALQIYTKLQVHFPDVSKVVQVKLENFMEGCDPKYETALVQ